MNLNQGLLRLITGLRKKTGFGVLLKVEIVLKIGFIIYEDYGSYKFCYFIDGYL